MLTLRDLMKVPHVEPRIALAVEAQQALHLGQRRTPRRRALASVIEQSLETVVLVAPAQTTHRPRADAQDLGHMDPRLTLLEGVQQDVGNLHGPLHCSPGVGHRHLPGGHDSPAACVERSDHLLSGAVR
ncbi:MAG: hypothetical protein AUH76_02060 [Candidatus Rokubacteria bacterium 13_1_40CM_4_67_11]|nr:MAG: hypothetical protein AUH76_02060 [Candidatus Rokubacteria bacterium 13_1_40CM_4_67_11]